MNSKTITKQQPILDLGNKGAAFKNGTLGKEIMRSEPSDSPPSSSNSTKILTIGITNRQSIINSKEEGQSVHLSLPEKSAGNGSAVPLDINDYISEVKGQQDFVEWDVEKVLEEQETHDLICPECKKCITKRVILRKRKRGGQDAGDDPRPNKLGIPGESPIRSINQGGTTNEYDGPDIDNGEDRDARPFIFRCLSCLSFFFPPDDKLSYGTGSGTQAASVTEDPYIGKHVDNQKLAEKPLQPGTTLNSIADSPDDKLSYGTGSGTQAASVTEDPYIGKHVDNQKLAEKPLQPGTTLNSIADSPDDKLSYGTGSGTQAASVTEDPYIGKHVDNQKLAEKPLQPGTTLNSIEDSPDDAGGDIIVDVDEPSAREGAREIVGAGLNRGEHIVDGTRRIHNLEIVKSIVYGGLIESITSLGVVSSAAGGDASTLNILALGLANLVAGLPIIAHSLEELKKDHDRGNQSNYKRVLGQRRNFWIHAVVAVISFLVCGIVPVVTYGFSFRQSDNKEYKLIAVAAASLFCVLLLSIGKAYIEKPPNPYVETMKFVMAGVTASGLSFAVGILVKGVLEKLGLFEPSPSVAAPPPPSLPFFEVTTFRNPAWASY
ncbi:hypothetical protein Syun_020075 [Stephania yunnanensis]|uniref:Membrane protein of ER body-like protein n=1 Tax=Stephania yunnanensis TaxID=152371 RepID=A0AAP0IVC5_9MAGN